MGTGGVSYFPLTLSLMRMASWPVFSGTVGLLINPGLEKTKGVTDWWASLLWPFGKSLYSQGLSEQKIYKCFPSSRYEPHRGSAWSHLKGLPVTVYWHDAPPGSPCRAECYSWHYPLQWSERSPVTGVWGSGEPTDTLGESAFSYPSYK